MTLLTAVAVDLRRTKPVKAKALVSLGLCSYTWRVSRREGTVDYAAREQEADFLMNQVFNVQENWSRIEAYQEFSEELVRAIVAEGGRLAAEVMAPLYEVGDTQCCQLQDGEVTTPPGFKEAFAQLTFGVDEILG